MTKSLMGKVAVVTGGASGIGLASDETMITEGALMVIFPSLLSHQR